MKLRVAIDGQSFEVEIGDLNARPILAVVDGDTFEVWPEENGKTEVEPLKLHAEVAAPVARSAVTPTAAPVKVADAANKVKSVPAPIPGVILSVNVKEGDKISFGQELCVLEAMKMKNIIRSNRAGTIATVCVAAGDQVRHGQTLIEYTD